MISALRAALVLGASSVIAIFMTLVTAKALAVLLGPRGVGEYALIQSIVDLAVLFAGLGVSVSLVRFLAEALTQRDMERVGAIRAGADTLAWALGGVAAAVIVLFREPLTELVFGSHDGLQAVLMAAVAVPFSLVATTKIAMLSAYGQVSAIAGLRTAAAVLLALTTIGAVMAAGETGIATGILASWILLASGSIILLRRRAGPAPRPSSTDLRTTMRTLVSSGAPFTASSIVGAGVMLAMPILVALQLDTDSAGFYRAATQVSTGYLTFVGAAMLQDYYPRLSAVQGDPGAMVRMIDQQLLVVLTMTMPLVLFGIAASEWIVPVLYSPEFQPAVGILNWALVGTLIRLPSWTLSFAILARGRMWVYFAAELTAGAVLLGVSLVGMQQLGVDGLGVAVLVSSLVYYPVVWLAVRRDLPLTVTRAQIALFVTVGLTLLVQVFAAAGLDAFRIPVALALTLVWLVVDIVAAQRILRDRRTRRRLAVAGRGVS